MRLSDEREYWDVVLFINDGAGPYHKVARARNAFQAVAFAATRDDGVWPLCKRSTMRAVAIPRNSPTDFESFEGPATDEWLEDVPDLRKC